ncbi:deoxyribodipyrimidine photo-lyase [Marinomonas agarivorans]|nr:deoxyribodipyrimidine photo-lyase [Marinomonas agarivorans]
MNIVWFKRDLRIEDNAALSEAARLGPVLPLYIFEPELWQQPDMSYRHYVFLTQCLQELDQSLTALGQRLIIKVGNAVDVLTQLAQQHSIDALWSHQETGNHWTYTRDKAVKHWCRSQQIPWYEPTQNGVIRGLKDRDGWAARWYTQMARPILTAPTALNYVDEATDTLPTANALGLQEENSNHRQKGGRSQALALLNSFLYRRGEYYTQAMSSPVTAFDSCSRLSAHLAFGTLSIREVFQITERRHKELKKMPDAVKGKWPSALRSFSGRLRWHCHFIQKLEDEPDIEFENMHPAYKTLREDTLNPDHLHAWQTGQTGYPMIDACMRALITTGWLNFRMRAMVMSFASYHLWLHWRQPALYLAQLFIDYEPGIHYSQVQMQSGTTGINAIRIYNPIKQGIDQDPEGVFIRQWVPELRDVDREFIHTPWLASSQINDYPMPIVDEQIARRTAADKIYTLRKNDPAHKTTAKQIANKHGSRKSGLPKTSRKKKKAQPDHSQLDHPQRELPF